MAETTVRLHRVVRAPAERVTLKSLGDVIPVVLEKIFAKGFRGGHRRKSKTA
jgi:hypothetical protein